jgi:hypothetical protein
MVDETHIIFMWSVVDVVSHHLSSKKTMIPKDRNMRATHQYSFVIMVTTTVKEAPQSL